MRWNKIKKVLTALLNENINNELKNNKNIKIVSNDLLYQEAVLEYLEENKEIDFLLYQKNRQNKNNTIHRKLKKKRKIYKHKKSL